MQAASATDLATSCSSRARGRLFFSAKFAAAGAASLAPMVAAKRGAKSPRRASKGTPSKGEPSTSVPGLVDPVTGLVGPVGPEHGLNEFGGVLVQHAVCSCCPQIEPASVGLCVGAPADCRSAQVPSR